MTITEVRIKIAPENAGNHRIAAFASITIDHLFVVRDLKIIEGSEGRFVAMPSRKMTDRCPMCGTKNHLEARFCNDCGCRLANNRGERDEAGFVKYHADVAHPISAEGRALIEAAVLHAYYDEIERVERERRYASVLVA